MKRWVIARHGRDSLRIDEVPTPSPSAGEVFVSVSAVALNARDLTINDEGMGLPFGPAADMAGVVEAVGDITSSSDEKLKRAKTLGAAHGIKRDAADVVREVLSITRGRGADHVLKLVGGENLERSLDAVSVCGRISIIGLLGGKELSAPTTPIFLRRRSSKALSPAIVARWKISCAPSI